ncbi:MAG: hypothetical protein ACEQSH_00085 [Bacteroidia bacterium]
MAKGARAVAAGAKGTAAGKPTKGRSTKPAAAAKGTGGGSAHPVTTGQVAEWLEARYHIMEVFYEDSRSAVHELIEESVRDKLEAVLMGAPPEGDPFLEAGSEIEKRFKQFLATDQMAKMGIPGIPTKAALMGINPRLKSGRGMPRPSFIRTGLYQSAFKAWVT